VPSLSKTVKMLLISLCYIYSQCSKCTDRTMESAFGYYSPAPTGRSIKWWCASDVCHVGLQREYSWRLIQLLEARGAGRRRRKGWAAAGPQRTAGGAYCVATRTAYSQCTAGMQFISETDAAETLAEWGHYEHLL